MPNVRFGEICVLSYHDASGPALPRMVRELSDRLHAFGLRSVSLIWDCDDIAVFDIPGHRIILAAADQPSAEVAAKFLISVGPAPSCDADPGESPTIGLSHSALCRRIRRAVERKHPACRKSNRSWPGTLSPERVDDMLYATETQPAGSFVQRQASATPLRTAVQAEEKRLRTALGHLNTRRQSEVMAAGLLINAMTWSMAAAAPAIGLTVLGGNILGTLLWASTTQLPR